MKRALISVSDKTNIEGLVKELHRRGIEIISTGGTRKVIEAAQIPVTSIESVTGNPEAFDGRMKTISFQVSSALLYKRDDESHRRQAEELSIPAIDLVVCNLYPFDRCVEENETDFETLIENIDIGGPTMIRSAAKNMQAVTVLTNPNQYDEFLKNLDETNNISDELRREYALEAFRLTAQYDLMIHEHLTKNFSTRTPQANLLYQDIKELRYGENSHQKASLYKTSERGIAHASQIQGKELSYNNLLDMEAAWKSAGDALSAVGDGVAVSVIKHLNPCGLSVGVDPVNTLKEAWNGDSTSAFGSIICTTAKVEKDFAEFFSDKFFEVLIAPAYSSEALEVFARKKNLRVMQYDNYVANDEIIMRSISGGYLVQDEDEGVDPEYQLVTKNESVVEDMSLVKFGIMACKHLKSNGIALVAKRGDNLVLDGAGMGQPNRIDSLQSLALPRLKEKGLSVADSMLISDAFFPFSDTIDVCQEAGITKVIQPGGSIRDNEVIEACEKYNISMAFTGRRHFRH